MRLILNFVQCEYEDFIKDSLLSRIKETTISVFKAPKQ